MREGARSEGRSTAEIVGDALDNARDLFRYEIRLAKVEVGQEVKKVSQGAKRTAVGAGVVFFGIWFLFVAGFLALALVMPYWASALIMGAALSVLGAVLVLAGIRKFKSVQPKPEDTIENVKEDIRLVKQRGNSE